MFSVRAVNYQYSQRNPSPDDGKPTPNTRPTGEEQRWNVDEHEAETVRISLIGI